MAEIKIDWHNEAEQEKINRARLEDQANELSIVSRPEHITEEFWNSLTNDGKSIVSEAAAQFELNATKEALTTERRVYEQYPGQFDEEQLNTAATRDYAEAELMSKLEAQLVQNQCAMVTAQALAALAAPETPEKRRNRIAEGFAIALTASNVSYRSPHDMIKEAIEAADLLVAELDK